MADAPRTPSALDGPKVTPDAEPEPEQEGSALDFDDASMFEEQDDAGLGNDFDWAGGD